MIRRWLVPFFGYSESIKRWQMVSKKKCPLCGADNPRAGLTCVKCGTAFALRQNEKESDYLASEKVIKRLTEVKAEEGRTRPAGRWGWITFGALLIVVALVPLILGYNEFRKQRESEGWPSVLGQIVSSEIHSEETGTPTRGVRWRYVVEYLYLVNGVEYSAKWSNTASTRQRAMETTQTKYVEGQRVHIYYNPLDPSTSVLEQGIHTRAGDLDRLWLMGGIGLIFGLVILISNISKVLKKG